MTPLLHRFPLTWRFAIAALAVIVTLGVLLARLLTTAIVSEDLRDARAEARDTLSRRVRDHLSPADFAAPLTGDHLRAFQQFVDESVLSERTAGIMIWDTGGRVIYAANPDLIGRTFAPSEEREAALDGRTVSEVGSTVHPEEDDGRAVGPGKELEVYTPIIFPGEERPVGVLEIYQSYAPVQRRIDTMRRYVIGGLGGGLALLYLALLGIVHAGARTIDRQHRALEDAMNQRLAEQRRAEDLLRKSGERFRSLVQNASDMIVVLSPDGTLQYVSASVERMLGYRQEEWFGRDVFALVHPEDRTRLRDAFVAVLTRPGTFQPIEFRLRHAGGSWRVMEASATNLLDDPNVRGIVENIRDITERKLLQEQLTHQAFHDSLTSLPNRALFIDRLAHALGAAKRHGEAVAVLFLDLDGFKAVNDSLGHSAGDALLVAVAGRLAGSQRPGDTIARLGGDEFIVLLEQVADPAIAEQVAERIITALQRPFECAGRDVFVTASIGIAVGTSGGDSVHADDLMRQADAAMYQAKNAGRNCAVLFDADMHARAVQRLETETALRRAVERGELRLHYQPEVSLESGTVVGLEALLRWQHSERGPIPPAEFIPLAEETGVILMLGRWVLEQACRHARGWQALRPHGVPLVVSVNISARQLAQPDFVAQVTEVLHATDLDPAALQLEIAESTLMGDESATVTTLHALRSLGVHLAIDNVGAGNSPLSYLRRVPVTVLKVNQSFMREAASDGGAAATVESVTTLARVLRISLTAEGIETAEQLARVSALGCDRGQGDFFSPALPSEELPDLAATGTYTHLLGGG